MGMHGWRRGLRAAAVLIALACAPDARGRALTVEDVLQREEFGRVVLSQRWLFAEVRGPYAGASRFDYDTRTDLLRTTLNVASLPSPGRLRPLFPPEPGVGYALGPVSPEGDQVAVFRLKGERWELGVAQPATGAVRWLGIAPSLHATARAVAWQAPDTLVVLALPAGDPIPLDLKLRRYPVTIAERRARTAAGDASATVIGSGRFLGLRPHGPDKVLLQVDLARRTTRPLASGPFTDFELSPDGRWAAVLSEGGDIPLSADRPVQGERGVETLQSRLTVIDTVSGERRAPSPAGDVLGQLLRWSPDSQEVLVFARQDGETWTQGRLFRVRAKDGVARAVGADIRPVVSGRPAVVRAGWMGRDPIVFARPVGDVGAGRADWFRLAGARAINLTARLPVSPRDAAVVSGEALWLVDGGRLWRVDRQGMAATSFVEGPALALVTPPTWGLRPRIELSPMATPDVAVFTRQSDTPAVRLGPGRPALPLPAGGQVVAANRSGAVVNMPPWDGPEVLSWVRPGAAPAAISTINRGLADVDGPRVIPVPHGGPRGERLTSWLMLPPARTESPPPLVVWPYPGSVYPTLPAYFDVRAGGGIETPALLVGQGYAVLIPSLPERHDGNGPAANLADRVLAIVDAAARLPSTRETFDASRLAIWGASFGGYGTLAIIGQTDRFAAAIVQAAPADLISMHGDFGLKRLALPEGGLGSNPSAGWTEDLQGGMGGPPWTAPERYVVNSPIFAADRIHTPLLIFHGDLDAIPIGQAQEMFSSLHRQNKDVVLVTYWGEGHSFASPGTIRDYYRRAFAWLDLHLRRSSSGSGPATPSPGPAPAPASGAPTPQPSPRP